ncbi:MAG: YbaN family protein [Planctomycetaceae bacterium]|nr:YbaN family protein [Planctomycetaceae bacterium]
MYGLKRPVYWALAAFFFALAMIGVVLPGIPTTPFLLLMCYFLIRVSPSLHAKAMEWPVVGGPLRDWRDQGGVRRRTKLTACIMVTLLVGATLLLGTLAIKSKLAILLVAIYGVSVVARLPTVK